MPKIPTYNSQGRITAEGPGVKTGIQISPRSTIAAALVPAANELTNYAIKRRNTEEQLIADKSILELKSESDKIIYSQKDNISEEDSINNYKKKFAPLVQEKLLSTKNRRVKQLIESEINIDNSENIYFLKKNSFEALEKDGLINVNNKITSILSKYSSVSDTAAGFAIKSKYRNQTENIIKKYATDFNLPDNVLQNHLKAAKSNFLIADMNQLVSFVNGSEQIKKLDTALNGTKFLNDGDFGVGLYNAYNAEISKLTIKGDLNANYPRAIELANTLKTFQRSNGYKVDTGELSVKISTLQEKILVEQIQHESLMKRQTINKSFLDYSKDLGKALTDDIADPYSDPELQDRLAAAEIDAEYSETIRNYLLANQDASLESKKEFARSLVYSLRNIYEDRQSLNVSETVLNQGSFDIESEYQRVLNDMSLLGEGKLDEQVLKQYKSLAKLNGYEIKTKDEDGNIKTIGDVKSFINEYLPVLENQVKITIQGE
mgnify:FL=1